MYLWLCIAILIFCCDNLILQTKAWIDMSEKDQPLGKGGAENDTSNFPIWRDATIPYLIDEFSFDKVLRDRIRVFLVGVLEETRLHFVELQHPPTGKDDRWVLFLNRRGILPCQDLPKITDQGVQRVVLGYDCLGDDGSALAPTVLALAGVPPQHNAPDRDNYIDIIKENIIPDKLNLFDVVPNEKWPFKDYEYDFESASHYHSFKYTRNGRATIISKNQSFILPTEEGSELSEIDILKIKQLYNGENKKRVNKECNKIFGKHQNKLKYTTRKTEYFFEESRPSIFNMSDYYSESNKK